jgi:hypothetical protein
LPPTAPSSTSASSTVTTSGDVTTNNNDGNDHPTVPLFHTLVVSTLAKMGKLPGPSNGCVNKDGDSYGECVKVLGEMYGKEMLLEVSLPCLLGCCHCLRHARTNYCSLSRTH